MVKVDDLIRWAKENAIGRSVTYINGWISADKLFELAEMVKEKEPFAYYPVFKKVGKNE